MDYKNQLKKFKKVSSVNELLVTNSRGCKDLIALQFTKKTKLLMLLMENLKNMCVAWERDCMLKVLKILR